MPLADMIFPWPKNGKVVSLLCLGLSIGCLFLAIALPSNLHASGWSAMWKIIGVLIVFPTVIYGSYLYRRVHKTPEGYLFVESDAKRLGWTVPLLIAAVVNLLAWLLQVSSH